MLTWFPSHEPLPEAIDAEQSRWTTPRSTGTSGPSRCGHQGDYHEEIHQSLLVLKALTYAPTGGIVAAPTTSLPEWIGGVRNWDYRFCWLRDATLTLLAMLNAGYRDEAIAWREWLLRAVAGDPADVQIMYGIAGERRLDECELDWLAGLRALGARCGSATPPRTSCSSTSTARSSTRSTRRACTGAAADDNVWSLIEEAARRGSRTAGGARTPGSGRCAGRTATSRTRR